MDEQQGSSDPIDNFFDKYFPLQGTYYIFATLYYKGCISAYFFKQNGGYSSVGQSAGLWFQRSPVQFRLFTLLTLPLVGQHLLIDQKGKRNSADKFFTSPSKYPSFYFRPSFPAKSSFRLLRLLLLLVSTIPIPLLEAMQRLLPFSDKLLPLE